MPTISTSLTDSILIVLKITWIAILICGFISLVFLICSCIVSGRISKQEESEENKKK